MDHWTILTVWDKLFSKLTSSSKPLDHWHGLGKLFSKSTSSSKPSRRVERSGGTPGPSCLPRAVVLPIPKKVVGVGEKITSPRGIVPSTPASSGWIVSAGLRKKKTCGERPRAGVPLSPPHPKTLSSRPERRRGGREGPGTNPLTRAGTGALSRRLPSRPLEAWVVGRGGP